MRIRSYWGIIGAKYLAENLGLKNVTCSDTKGSWRLIPAQICQICFILAPNFNGYTRYRDRRPYIHASNYGNLILGLDSVGSQNGNVELKIFKIVNGTASKYKYSRFLNRLYDTRDTCTITIKYNTYIL